MSSYVEKLGNTLTDRMKSSVQASVQISVELGTINANLSLSVDSLKTPIPKGEYMVSLQYASETYRSSVESHTHDGGGHPQYEGDGVHTHSGGSHDHRLPESFRELQDGDRVLVAWAGNDPVVISIVVAS